MERPLPAYTGQARYVFASYAHADADLVFPEIRWLQDQGVNVWYDTTGIGPGTEWNEEIARAIKGADSFLFFITPRSATSEHCRREVNFAQSEQRTVVGIHLEETRLPDGLRLSLDNRQALLKYQLTESDFRGALLKSCAAGPPGTDAVIEVAVSSSAPKPRTHRHRLAFALPLLLSAALVLGWWFSRSQEGDASPMERSVAVLPFTGIGLTGEAEWLALGIPAELTDLLASVPGLRVASRQSAFAMHKAGREPTAIGTALGVTHVLTGSLQRRGNELALSVELIRSPSSEVEWREMFTGSMSAIGAVQSELAGRIFKYFGAQYSPYNLTRPKTEAAYRAHLNRLTYYLSGNPEEELKWAEMTVHLEPDFAMGYVNLVWPYLYPAITDPEGPWLGKARAALDRAAALGLAESSGYAAQEGLFQWMVEGDLDRAEVLLRKAFLGGDEQARISYPALLASSGMNKPVRDFLERLTVVEPFNPLAWENYAIRLAYEGDYEGASAALSRALVLVPGSYFLLESRAITFILMGDLESAGKDLEMLRTIANYPPLRLADLETRLRFAQGDREFAMETAQTFAANGAHLWAGGWFLRLEDHARAAQELELAAAAGTWITRWLSSWTWRMPPREREGRVFREFSQSLGYTDAWQQEICRRVATHLAASGLHCDTAESID